MAKTKASTFVTGSIIFLVIILISGAGHYRNELHDGITHYKTRLSTDSKSHLFDNQFNLPPGQNWSRIIWQTSKYPSENQDGSQVDLARSWAEMNPYHRHEMMTHERALGYVEDTFREQHPELEQLYLNTHDYMLRTDVIRFLLLLKEGGVYSDLDVTCLKPIDTWLSPELREKAGVVIGVEIDNDLGPDGKTIGGLALFQFAAWTIMAKPNQPFIRYVVDGLIKRLANVTAAEQKMLSQKEVLQLTGPAAMSTAFLEYASMLTGTNMTHSNFSRITEPVMYGEVVVLPIWSFGGEHQVVNSGFQNDGKALVKHWFANSWKIDHHEK